MQRGREVYLDDEDEGPRLLLHRGGRNEGLPLDRSEVAAAQVIIGDVDVRLVARLVARDEGRERFDARGVDAEIEAGLGRK